MIVAVAFGQVAEEEVTIVSLLEGNPIYSTLTSLLTATGLLQNATDMTVIAPNNDAFATFLATNPDFVAYNDKPWNVEILPNLLTYHALRQKLSYKQLYRNCGHAVDGEMPASASSSKRTLYDNQFMTFLELNHALSSNGTRGITSNDQPSVADDGYVHEINTVMIPTGLVPIYTTIADAAAANGYNIFLLALAAADLTDPFTSVGDTPYTVFAPTDKAFVDIARALGFSEAADLLLPENRGLLTEVLTYHVIGGESLGREELAGTSQTTLNPTQEALEFSMSGLKITAFGNKPRIMEAFLTWQGYMYGVNEVLIPNVTIVPP